MSLRHRRHVHVLLPCLQDVTISIDLDSSSMANSGPCAAELATTNRCLLKFVGTAEPVYMGYKLPAIPVEFEQYVTR